MSEPNAPGPGGSSEREVRAELDRGTRRVLAGALAENRTAIGAGALLLCVYQVAEASVPIALGQVVDQAFASPSWCAPMVSIAVVGAIILIVSAAWRSAFRLLQAATARTVERLRESAAERVVAARDTGHDLPDGEVATVLGEDATQAADIVEIVPVSIAAALGLVFCTSVLAAIDPVLGGVVLCGTVLLLALLQVLSGRVAARGEAHQQLIAAATARVADLLRGLRPLSGFGGRAPAHRRYVSLSDRARREGEALARLTGMQEGVAVAMGTLLVGAVGIVAGLRAFDSAITIGELVTVVGLAQFVAEPLRQLSRMPRFAALARASARRIARLHGGEATQRDRGADVPAVGAVPAVEVAFGDGAGNRGWSAGEGQLTVVDCALSEAAAVVAALVAGCDGCGGQPVSGPAREPEGDLRVKVRGIDARVLDPDALRDVVLAVGARPAVFRGTLGDAVRAGGRFSRESDPVRAIDAAVLDEVAERSVLGVDRPIADRGADLSGGQRQRLVLARALHADPEILILVDPTSSVDSVTAEAMARGIAGYRARRTTVVLAGGPAFSRVADHRTESRID